MITKTENYYLNQPVEDAPGLNEYSDEEYQMFAAAGWKKMLADEKIYHGKETNFNGSVWDTVVGATNGKIFKISLQIADADKNKVQNIFKSTFDYLIGEMGEFNEHPFLSNMYVWYEKEGNFIYERASKFGYECINIFITSSSIRGFLEEPTIPDVTRPCDETKRELRAGDAEGRSYTKQALDAIKSDEEPSDEYFYNFARTLFQISSLVGIGFALYFLLGLGTNLFLSILFGFLIFWLSIIVLGLFSSLSAGLLRKVNNKKIRDVEQDAEMVCPKCRATYIKGINTCSDCGIELIPLPK